jgi:transposase
MSQGVRVIGPDRAQLRWEMVDLDSQLPDDHRARLVWAFVQGLDLGEFYDRIKARDEVAGRPATDPQVVLAVWLYATMEGIGSARAIDRLCQQHAAYRWLCGGAPINHDLLATFRRENAAALDRLLTQSLTGLIAEKLITLEELTIDGTKVRAHAGLDEQAQAVGEHREGGGGTGRGTEGRAGQGSRRAGAPAQAAGPASGAGARAGSSARTRSCPSWYESRLNGPRRTSRKKPKRVNQKYRSATPRRAPCGWPTAP